MPCCWCKRIFSISSSETLVNVISSQSNEDAVDAFVTPGESSSSKMGGGGGGLFAAVFLKVENNPDGGDNCGLPFDDAARGGVVGCLLYLPGDVMDLNQEDGEVSDGDLGELAAAAVAILLLTSVWLSSFSADADLDARGILEFCFLGVGSNSSSDG